MSAVYVKDPDAILDYTFDWGSWLTEGDAIAEHTIVADDGITVETSMIAADSSGANRYVVAWLSGGTAGRRYTVTCRITTSTGRVDDRSMLIVVADR